MTIAVVQFTDKQARKAKEGIRQLEVGMTALKKDLRDHRVDARDMNSFLEAIRATADYFESIMIEKEELASNP